jgi:hypothetical protein
LPDFRVFSEMKSKISWVVMSNGLVNSSCGVLKVLTAYETSAINNRHGATFPEYSNLQQYPLQKLSIEYITLLLGIVKSFVYS